MNWIKQINNNQLKIKFDDENCNTNKYIIVHAKLIYADDYSAVVFYPATCKISVIARKGIITKTAKIIKKYYEEHFDELFEHYNIEIEENTERNSEIFLQETEEEVIIE